MGRLLSLIVLVALAVWLVRRALRRMDSGAPESGESRARDSEELVRCAHCGLLLPRAEARQSGGALYCGEEHARLGPRPGAGR